MPLVGIMLNIDAAQNVHSIVDVLVADASFNLQAFNALVSFKWKEGKIDL